MNNKYSIAQLAAIYTVYKDLNNNHIVHCCTCGRSLYVNQIEDCFNYYGHFISRSIEPKLKFHPLNTHAQCPSCNMQFSSEIDKKYYDYMTYRYGNNIKDILINDETYVDLDKTKNFYIQEILKLSTKFPELLDVVINSDTGELKDVVTAVENPIEEQWDTFSQTYKQDLDTLTKLLGTEPIEYERF